MLDATNHQPIYVVTYYPEGGLIAKAMLETKSPATCLADFGAYDNGFVTTAGVAAAQSCPIIGVPAPGDFPGAASLVVDYQKAFGSVPGTWGPYAYDSVRILADAATKAGSFESAPPSLALGAEKGWTGWIGSVTFDPATGTRVPVAGRGRCHLRGRHAAR